jgi:hypothetical protein
MAVCPPVTRVRLCQNEATDTNNDHTAHRIAYFFSSDQGLKVIPIGRSFRRLQFGGKTLTPPKERVSLRYIFRPQRLNGVMTSGKIPTQLIPDSTTNFPVRPTPNLSGGFETPSATETKIQHLHFSPRKTAFERQKSTTDFRFEQTSCSLIAEPSSILWWKIFHDWLLFSGKYRQFCIPT